MRSGRLIALCCLVVAWGCSGDSNDGELPAGVGTATGGGGGAATGGTGTGGTAAGTAGPVGGTMMSPTGGTGGAAATGGTTAMGTGGTAAGMGATGGTSGMSDAGAMNSGGSGGGPNVDGSLFTVESQLASDVQPDAPGTIGIVTWSTTIASVASARIEFGLDESYGMEAPVDLEEPDYRTLLLGMKPSQTYHFRVVASDGTTEQASDDFTIDTGPPNTNIDIDYEVLDAAAHEQGFIVSSTLSDRATSYAFILDSDGEVVWWYDFGSSGIARARMSADGKNMWMVVEDLTAAPVQRVTMDTLDEQTYSGTSGSHDITPVSGATMAYLDYGESDCDSIFEIDPSGTTVEVFEAEAEFGGGGGGGLLGGCHSNAVRYSQTEDVYVYTDVSEDVVIVDRDGAVRWRLSEILTGGIASLGGRQHGQHLLDDSIVVFANDGGGRGTAAVLEYTLEGEEIFRYVSGEGSQILGDAQRMPGGNTLATYSASGVVHEVDPDGNLVMRYSGSLGFGYSLFRPTLYGPPPDIAQ